MSRTQIWSSGGGVQSTAIAALICMGELRPDLSVIIDTERELSTTWTYLDKWVLPALERSGVTLHRVTKSDYATVDLISNEKYLIPAFTTQTGDIGKLPTYCSHQWKRRVMQRWATQNHDVKQVDIWIGFTTDELRRVSQPIGKWQHVYPLINRRMSRGDCIAMVKRIGWPEPPRSSCWMCPNKSPHEWQWQKDHSPADFQRAIEFENDMQHYDQDLWLTKSGSSLESFDTSTPNDMFTGRCDSGMCFV